MLSAHQDVQPRLMSGTRYDQSREDQDNHRVLQWQMIGPGSENIENMLLCLDSLLCCTSYTLLYMLPMKMRELELDHIKIVCQIERYNLVFSVSSSLKSG